MKQTISTGLRTTFLIHGIVAILIGLGFTLIPLSVIEWLNLPAQDDVAIRLVGITLVTLGVMSWLALREAYKERIIALMQLQLIWDVLALLVFVWALFIGPTQEAAELLRANAAVWVFALIIAVFTVVFGYFYTQEEEFEAPEPTGQTPGRTSA